MGLENRVWYFISGGAEGSDDVLGRSMAHVCWAECNEVMASRVWEAGVMKWVFTRTLRSSKDQTRKDVVGQMDFLHAPQLGIFLGTEPPSPSAPPLPASQECCYQSSFFSLFCFYTELGEPNQVLC